MSGGVEPDPAPAARPGTPRAHPLLVVSLVLSAVSFALPAAFGPLGPLAAGILALVGYRKARAAPAEFRGPGLARVAMTLALAVFALQAWVLVRHSTTLAAWSLIQREVERVDANLRTGTAEGAYELLAPEVRARTDRAAFVGDLRAVTGRLGALERLGEATKVGGDWERTDSFERGDAAVLRLPMAIEAQFRGGPGRVEIEVVVRRTGGEVSAGLTALRVVPR
jgi:hypothetical protein